MPLPNNDRHISTDAPTDLCTYTIEVDGTELSRKIQIDSIEVDRVANKIASARIRVLDGVPSSNQFPISQQGVFKIGAEIRILLGYHSVENAVFEGIIVKQRLKASNDGNARLVIWCKHQAEKMAQSTKRKLFLEHSCTDMIEKVVGDYGIPASIESDTNVYEQYVQHQQTDWDFIRDLANKHGQIIDCDIDGIRIYKADFSQSAAQTFIYGASMRDIDIEIDARRQISTVLSNFWNIENQAIEQNQAAEEDLGRSESPTLSELSDALEMDEEQLWLNSYTTPEHNQVYTDAYKKWMALASRIGRISCVGNHQTKLGDIITLEGLSDTFNGDVFVSGLKHEVVRGKWITHIQFGLELEIPSNQNNSHNNALYIAKVIQLAEDPKGEERILVHIPAFHLDNTEGIWARWASLDAGAEHGWLVRPQIDDEVVVSFLENNIQSAVIIGSLFSSAQASLEAATDENYKRTFYTPAGLQLQFDDEKKSIQCISPNGNEITLSDDEKGILFKDENGNEIILNADGIKISSQKDIVVEAASGDFNLSAVNVTQSAQSNAKVEGTAGAEISSAGNCVVKGAMVQIN